MRILARGFVLLLIGLGSGRPAEAQQTASPHGSLDLPCATCHEARAWRPARIAREFDHARLGFALTGAHAGAACLSCHQTLDFRGTGATCASCHRDVHQGELGVACERCHQTRSFKDQADMFRVHQQSRFPLEGAHAAVECRQCHTPAPEGGSVWRNRQDACLACHQGDVRAVRQPDHAAAGFTGDCASCHQTSGWAGGRFDHGTTAYPLVGAHALATCAGCHASGIYRGHDQACVACHEADFARAANPPHQSAGFPTDCTVCHAGPTRWTGAVFDHTTTDFPLTGAHQAASCRDCHADGVYAGKSVGCASCHQQDYDAAKVPDHRAAAFPTVCAQCHGTAGWAGAAFQHSAGFPLTGGHQAVACLDCHGDGVWRGKPSTCVSCHRSDYDRTTTPAHASAGFPTECAGCHTIVTWTGATFNHGATQFPLTGAHAAVSCLACHGDGVYDGRSTTCLSCHQADYDRVTTPNHRTQQFPTDCTACHTTSTWPGAHFSHDATQFPLTGAHRAANCADCHADGVYDGKPVACLSCHQADFDGSTVPPHKSLSFPADCTSCHTTAGWTGGTYNHSVTRFPLTGAHLAVACAQCHGDGVWRGKPATCVSCHQADYDRVTTPNHRTQQFPTDCTACHTTAAWPGATFNHDATQFPLTGAHRAVVCADCHADGVYDGKPVACLSCHQADFDGSAVPPHKSLSFPADCTSCHTTAGWAGGTYNHSVTQFPLTGAHLAVACAQCHGDGVWRGKPSTCVSCHQADYDRVTTPNHKTLSFPTDCTACHTTAAWPGATFNHDATQFPLTGAHRAVVCTDCHADGVYDGKPVACLSCHQADFDGTTVPPHKSLSFPADCTSCHTTAGWAGGTYNHSVTQFPLTGAHLAVACAQCHGDGVWRGKPSTCVSCHQADYDGTVDPNHRTAGFPTDCTACHSTAGWAGARFDHDAQYFPIYSGKHAGKWTTCGNCHTNSTSYAVFSCLTCHEHNQTRMDEKHRERNGYRYDSQACLSCHPRGD